MRQYKCPSCKKVFSMNDGSRLSNPNTCCGYKAPEGSPFSRTMWPSLEVKHVMKFLNELNLDEFEYRRVAMVFLCATLETLLQEALYDLLPSYTSSLLLAENLLKRSEGLEARLKLFTALNEKSVHKILKANGMESFWTDWKSLADARNHIGHGTFFHTPVKPGVDLETEEKRLITAVKEDMLKAFTFIVNGIKPIEPPAKPLEQVSE